MSHPIKSQDSFLNNFSFRQYHSFISSTGTGTASDGSLGMMSWMG